MNMAAHKSNAFMLSKLLDGLAELQPGNDRPIEGLCIDSRQALPGDIFFALAGSSTHGLRFLKEVIDRGVAVVLWEPDEQFTEDVIPLNNAAVPIVAVENLTQKLGVIASRFYGEPSKHLSVVGITGTDGKTSCSLFMMEALNQAGIKTGVIGTLGYGLPGSMQTATHTTPDAIRVHKLLQEMLAQGSQSVVMETSSHGLDQGRVNGVDFDIAVLTNLTRDHLDYHGDLKSYKQAKEILFNFPNLNYAVLNLDDEFGKQIAKNIDSREKVLGFAMESVDVDNQDIPVIFCEQLAMRPQGMQLSIIAPWGRAKIETSLLGKFNASNLLATVSVLVASGIGFKQACELASTLKTAPGRMEVFNGRIDRPRVIVDYAHTPSALAQVLSATRQHAAGKVWCIFGCGGDRDKGKRALMGEVASRLADQVIITNDNPRNEAPDAIVNDILSGLKDRSNVSVEYDRATAIRATIGAADPADLVLVAGKGHETYQLIGDDVKDFSDREFVTLCLQGEDT